MKNYWYTPEEDRKILKKVKENPTNLSQSFRELSTELTGRSAKSIKNRYYNALQKKKRNKIFFLMSNKKTSKNYKNVYKCSNGRTVKYTPEDNTLSKWRRILKIIFE